MIFFTASFSAVRVYNVSLNHRRILRRVHAVASYRREPFVVNKSYTMPAEERERTDSRYFALFPRESGQAMANKIGTR